MPAHALPGHRPIRDHARPGRQRWAVLTTYPPTACGIATFSRSLIRGLGEADVDVVRLVDVLEPPQPGVVHQWVRGEPDALGLVTDVLNTYDLVLVQHEFGIFPGLDGDEVVTVLAGVRVPVVTVAHTVLATPTAHQRQVLRDVLTASDAVVTMTRTAATRLVEGYDVAPADIQVIPHGVADALVAEAPAAARPATGPAPASAQSGPARSGPAQSGPGAPATTVEARPVVLTWGLLGDGKGIEWGLDAMAELRDLTPRPLYVVAGRTHPRVLEREGEKYRDMLTERAAALGITDDVRFVDDYLDDARLHRLIKSAAVVLLPYDSVDQVTSGVLSEAVAAGRPVVSTLFPHAVEVLADGVGMLVPQRDAPAIAAALRRVLTDHPAAADLRAKATAVAPELTWSRVADRYRALGRVLIDSRTSVDLRSPQDRSPQDRSAQDRQRSAAAQGPVTSSGSGTGSSSGSAVPAGSAVRTVPA